ncbi:atrial natriuretic peptide-converting enzyme-like isoform X1, partial [Argonauta hians]
CAHLRGKQKLVCLKEARKSNNRRCAGLRGKERAKCMKRGPPQNNKVNRTRELIIKENTFSEPLGPSRIRLAGNTSFYNTGLIHVFRNNTWGYVCDDDWDIEDANVACKQLGFSRGAEIALTNSKHGEVDSKDFLMDNTKCSGEEKALQYCPYDIEHDCSGSEAAGVICKTNTGCKPGWISGPSGCYRLFTGNAQRHKAKETCYSKGSHLVIIDSQEENEFLSVILAIIKTNNVWLTDGYKVRDRWAWRSLRKYISTFYWFPGWNPGNKFHQPKKDGSCISLSNMFEYDHKSYMTNYYFWKTSNCDAITGFICERAKAPNSTEECYHGNGVSYRGFASETLRGTPCLSWSENLKFNRLNKPNAGLGDHNYCRNPDNDKRPWCWVAPAYKNQFGFCKIDQCENDTETTTVGSITTTTTSKTTEAQISASTATVPTVTCSSLAMLCNSTNICIPLIWKCDGEVDCIYGDDEQNCEVVGTCGPDKMLCSASNMCIPLNWKCDGDSDCTDGEDENNCVTETTCESNSTLCPGTDTCIPVSWRCDGDKDCPGGEDEDAELCESTSRPATCPPGKFPCSQNCIPERWLCDGEYDCLDESDEKNCSLTTQSVLLTTTPSLNCPIDQMYCSAGQKCISLAWKCDGENDCSDGEDENNCVYTLNKFEKQGKDFIINAIPRELYVQMPLETCARTCLLHREFVCKAFHYKEGGKKCKLFDTDKFVNRRPSVGGFYYVLSKNCSQTDFKCKNGRCIPSELKCDGTDDCNDFSDEQICGVPEEIDIRLADGQEHTGRVEIKYHNEWGVICDDRWDIADAHVVCRMLGYNGASKAVPFSNFGAGNANFLLTNVGCFGNETSLLDCPKDPWRQHNCKRHETAGVICELDKACPENQFECANSQCIDMGFLCDDVDDCGDNTDEKYCTASVTLANGTNPSNGRIQITINNITGTVCDDSFDNRDAEVVCKQLGYKSGISLPGGTFGKGKGIIWLDEVNCKGNESSIDQCDANDWGSHDCDHTEDAAVQCFNEVITTTTRATTTTAPTTTVVAPVCGKIPRLRRTKRADRKIEDIFYSKIVNGEDAVYGRYPWQVAIQQITSQNTNYISASHFCGGTIVHKDWIISAGHCFVGKKKEGLIVKAGDHNNKVWDKYEQSFRIDELITHPKYDDNTYDYDIALLKLQPNRHGNGIIFNDYVQPACLPDKDTVFRAGERCHISGWGNTGKAYPSILKAATVPLMERKLCKSLYKNSITPRMMCAGYLEGGIDSCQGDSGGPLVCNKNGVYTLTGVTSWGNGCAKPRNPGVYAKVQQLRPWIDYIMKKYS